MEVHGGAVIHQQPVEGIPRQSRWMPEGGCDPVGIPRWSRILPGPVERRAHTRAPLLAGLVTPWGTHNGAACS